MGVSRLKIGNDFQYQLNAKGSTPAEIMGVNYKLTLKPALSSSVDDLKKCSMENLEKVISLQETTSAIAARIEGKRNHIAELQSRANEVSDSCLELYTMILTVLIC